MATRLSSGVLAPSGRTLTQVSGPTNSSSADTRNVTQGPATVFGITVDNQKAVASNTKIWAKLYDATTQGWTPGTDLAFMGFPVEAWTSEDDSQGIGTYQACFIPDGLPFANGVSIAAVQTAGDGGTGDSDPATNIIVELVH